MRRIKNVENKWHLLAEYNGPDEWLHDHISIAVITTTNENELLNAIPEYNGGKIMRNNHGISVSFNEQELRLQHAQDLAVINMMELANRIDRIIRLDNEFLKSGLARYKFTINPDEQNDSKSEADFETVLPLSYCERTGVSVFDIATHYMHVMAHKKCAHYWKSCPVPMSSFTSNEINFIEEMFNQRYIRAVSPPCYTRFYYLFDEYDRFLRFENRLLREDYNRLLSGDPIPNTVPEYLQVICEQLYQSDPLLQATFDIHIAMFYSAKVLYGFAEDILKYDQRK